MIKLLRLKIDGFKSLGRIDLILPERGRVLIEGDNESGKSSLFEAVYFGIFGDPLITEDNRGCLDDLIPYGTDTACVAVELSVEDRRLLIERRLTRGRPSVAAMTISSPEGLVLEESNSVSGIRRRVAGELGLDGQAFLNSVFVEQKKLERLESLSAGERRRALLSLLNLEVLAGMEEAGRGSRQEIEELGRLRAALRLALVRRDMSDAEIETAVLGEEIVSLRRAEADKASARAEAETARLEAELASLSEKWAEAAVAAGEPAQAEVQAASLERAGLRFTRALQIGCMLFPLMAAVLLWRWAGPSAMILGALTSVLLAAGAWLSGRRRCLALTVRAAELRRLAAELRLKAAGREELAGRMVETNAGILYLRRLQEDIQAGLLPLGSGQSSARLAELEELLQGKERFIEQCRGEESLLAAGSPRMSDDVPPEELRRRVEAAEEDLALREMVAEMAGLAREGLVRRILPATITYMRRLMPLLTADRYHDVEIGDDYRIRIWDERAGGWRSKNIFSGGTRDQLSLALRLSFALATLPQERGSAPSFIFLDEPLSSFDDERADALLALVSGGEVAAAFDQIFIISHHRDLPSSCFDLRLRLDMGRLTVLDDASGACRVA